VHAGIDIEPPLPVVSNNQFHREIVAHYVMRSMTYFTTSLSNQLRNDATGAITPQEADQGAAPLYPPHLIGELQ
jgi:hypothetical protein